MRFFFLSYLLLFLVFDYSVHGQNRVNGTIQDLEGNALIGATVVLLHPQDSTLKYFSIANKSGNFEIAGIKSASYLKLVSFLGYQNNYEEVVIDGDLELGTLYLDLESTELQEFVVEGERIPIQFKKDTIEYDAKAFKAPVNSSVEALLKRLPGIEVERNGTIKAHGETVQKIMVDGKEFFGDDPQIASKNLPADIVDKVQVFDKKSDLASFSGIEDGQEQKTINLELKEGKKQGVFGSLSGAIGDRERYSSKVNVNRFSAKYQMSLIGQLNNVNDRGFSISDYINFMGGLRNLMSGGGGMKLSLGEDSGLPINTGNNNGFVSTAAGGANFNFSPNKKTDIYSSYFFNRNDERQETSRHRQNFLGANTFDAFSENAVATENSNHRLNVNLKSELDSSQMVRLRASFGYGRQERSGDQSSSTYDFDQQLTNQGKSVYSNINQEHSFSSTLSYQKKLVKRGRLIGIEGSFSAREEEGRSFLNTENDFINQPDLVDQLRQRQEGEGSRSAFGGKLSYTEPLSQGKYLNIYLETNSYDHKAVKDFYDLKDKAIEEKNLDLSRDFKYGFDFLKTGANLKISRRDVNGSIGLSYQASALFADVVSIGEELGSQYRHFLPSLRINYDLDGSSTLSFSYFTSITAPDIEQLQPVVNNRNPLRIFVGNPDLTPEYLNEMRLSFHTFDQFNFRNLFVDVFVTYTEDKITNSSATDEFFVTQLQPLNVKDDWSYSGSLSFGSPIKPLGLKGNIDLDFRGQQGRTFINSLENLTNNRRLGYSLSLENRRKDWIDVLVGFRINHNRSEYSVNERLGRKFSDETLFVDLNVDFGKNWSLGSSFDFKKYQGDNFEGDQEFQFWEASLSKSFLKNERGEMSIIAKDILNQNNGFDRRSSLNFIEEEQVQTLARYFLIKFTYRLSAFAGGSQIKVEESRR